MAEQMRTCCVDGMTHILLADGSSKMIWDIRAGECVQGNKGKTHKVANVIIGYSEKILEITVASGETLHCTGDHPILTEGGVKRASELTTHDKIMHVLKGAQKITEIKEKKNGGRVFNLLMEQRKQSCFFVAENLIIGDFKMQRKQL